MPRFPGVVGPSYTLQSVNLDCQRCVNFYYQKDEMGTGKDQSNMLVGTPGLKLWGTLGIGPIRGVFLASNGNLYVVSGNGFYYVNSLGVGTLLGTIYTQTGRVDMADNGIQLMLVDGSTQGYVYTFTTKAFVTVSAGGFLGGNRVAMIDDYFLANTPGTSQFAFSNIADGTNWPNTNWVALASDMNVIQGVMEMQRMLWVFGTAAIDIYYDSGDSLTPWQRFQPGFIHYGCASGQTIQRLNNVLFWLGGGDSGHGVVFKAAGISAQRISTTAVELAIQSYGDLSGATAYTYQQDGHGYYVLNIPGANTTWVYDDSNGLWHERTYTTNGVEQRHRGEVATVAYGKVIVGDYLNGNLYYYDSGTLTDNGAVITRTRTVPHLSKNQVRIFHKRIVLDMETGVGIDGAGQGSTPSIMLSWSDDGGHVWRPERTGGIGPIGQFRYRVFWDRLGMSRNRVYRFRITDPVKVAIYGADIYVDLSES